MKAKTYSVVCRRCGSRLQVNPEFQNCACPECSETENIDNSVERYYRGHGSSRVTREKRVWRENKSGLRAKVWGVLVGTRR